MLRHADPLLTLGILLVSGFALGGLARRIRLPGITGQIVAGFLLGHAGFGLGDAVAGDELRPVADFALALIGVTVGAHLNLRRLRNAGKRLGFLAITECTVTPVLVAAALWLLTDLSVVAILLLATISISTAPATVVSVVRELRARGVLVKTLFAGVAVNNIACILFFETSHSLSRLWLSRDLDLGTGMDPTMMWAFLAPIGSTLGAIGLGGGAGLLVHWMTRQPIHPARLASISATFLLLTYGAAQYLGLSELLAAMALGVVQTNLNPARELLVDSVFSNFEPVIYCTFFTLAGAQLELDQAVLGGVAALAFFAARAFGKIASARMAMRFAGSTSRIKQNLGLALLPQAGVAVGLVLLVEGDPAFSQLGPLFVAIVLTAVTLSEIVGPVAVRMALARSGEVGRDRPTLLDFIQEENIMIDLRAADMNSAIEVLSRFLLSSHQIGQVDPVDVWRSAQQRESLASTCVGGGLAVPHAELDSIRSMAGVIGISREGLPFETPDGVPLHCIVLTATPRDQRDRHLAVLAALARMMGSDPALQEGLYHAESAAHVYELLHGETSEKFNYFLDSGG